MIVGIGTDIIEIKRIENVIRKYGMRFLERVFTDAERKYCLNHQESARHFAGKFAAKEAVVKALGTGLRHGISWQDIEILNDSQGKPTVNLSKQLLDMVEPKGKTTIFHISISHCREYATAFAIQVC